MTDILVGPILLVLASFYLASFSSRILVIVELLPGLLI